MSALARTPDVNWARHLGPRRVRTGRDSGSDEDGPRRFAPGLAETVELSPSLFASRHDCLSGGQQFRR
jgi:hypothetical protein